MRGTAETRRGEARPTETAGGPRGDGYAIGTSTANQRLLNPQGCGGDRGSDTLILKPALKLWHNLTGLSERYRAFLRFVNVSEAGRM